MENKKLYRKGKIISLLQSSAIDNIQNIIIK